MPFTEPDDRVRRQKAMFVGLGKGSDAISLGSLAAPVQFWVIALFAAFAFTVLLWRIIPTGVDAAAAAFVVYRLLGGKLGIAFATLVALVLVVGVFGPTRLIYGAPLLLAPPLSLYPAWRVAKMLGHHVDADRPFRYWLAVFWAELNAIRPDFPRGTR